VLAGDVLVLELLGLLGGLVQHVLQAPPHVDVGGGPAHLRLLIEGCLHLAGDRLGIHAQLPQQRTGHALLLLEEREQQVLGRDLLMVALISEIPRRAQRLLRLDGQLFESHSWVTINTASFQTRKA
jgi:hypothetical protein